MIIFVCILCALICVPCYIIWKLDSESRTLKKLYDAALLSDSSEIRKILNSRKSRKLSNHDRYVYMEHARILEEYRATLRENL